MLRALRDLPAKRPPDACETCPDACETCPKVVGALPETPETPARRYMLQVRRSGGAVARVLDRPTHRFAPIEGATEGDGPR